jgi:hypothetical protein
MRLFARRWRAVYIASRHGKARGTNASRTRSAWDVVAHGAGAIALLVAMGGAPPAPAAERHAREVPQVNCSKGQYRFDPRRYRCLEVTVYELRNGRRVARIYHVWEKRREKR